VLRWPPAAGGRGIGIIAFIPSLPATSDHHGLIGTMTKIIQLVGALLGTLLGFALGLLILSKADTTIIEAPNRPAS